MQCGSQTPVAGMVAVPDKPDLGIELDPTTIAEFRWQP
jgi:L-alanine-DL-glutamate epimerase-like enolase superfamily enzyme